MRGISLPIETIIIIAVTVLVMVVVATFFIVQSGQSIVSITDDAALAQGCTELASRHSCDDQLGLNKIKISNYETKCPTGDPGPMVTRDGVQICNSLMTICIKKGFPNQADCRKTLCKCPS